MDERRGPRIQYVEGEPEASAGVVVLLHGANEALNPHPAWLDPAYLRMPSLRRVLRRATKRQVAVAQIYHAGGGWDIHGRRGPDDARHAFGLVRERFPGLPLCVVAHSSGGCVALRAGDDPDIVSIVALAPYVSPHERADHLAGRDLLVVHGDRDHVASFPLSEDLVARINESGGTARFVRMPAAGHFMVRGAKLWHSLAADHVVRTLLSAI